MANRGSSRSKLSRVKRPIEFARTLFEMSTDRARQLAAENGNAIPLPKFRTLTPLEAARQPRRLTGTNAEKNDRTDRIDRGAACRNHSEPVILNGVPRREESALRAHAILQHGSSVSLDPSVAQALSG
jgi:hypothetical protein